MLAGAITRGWAGMVVDKPCVIPALAGPGICNFFPTANYCGSPGDKFGLNVLFPLLREGKRSGQLHLRPVPQWVPGHSSQAVFLHGESHGRGKLWDRL